MNKLLATITVIVISVLVAAAQKPEAQPLRLIQSIPMPGIDGDFDHFGVDIEGNRLFLAAEDHKTVEVFELRTGKPIQSISGFGRPHSILYRPDTHRIFVTDGDDGSCKILDGKNYSLLKQVKLASDADPIAFDPASKYLFIGNGGKDAGWTYSHISIIDTSSGDLVGEIKLDSANLEAMAFETGSQRMFINIRDKNQVGVLDRQKRTLVNTWNLTGVEHNTPMALDEAHHRLFIAGRKPGKFVVLDSQSGKQIANLPGADGADDMFYDAAHRRIYVSCAEGFVNVYEQKDADHYEPLANIATGFRAKMSLLVPQLNRYYVAVSQNGKEPAKLLIFEVAR